MACFTVPTSLAAERARLLRVWREFASDNTAGFVLMAARMRLSARPETPSVPDNNRADFEELDAMPRKHAQTPQLEHPINRETLEPTTLTNDSNCC